MGNHGRRHRGTVQYCMIPYDSAMGLGATAQNGMVGGVSRRPPCWTPESIDTEVWSIWSIFCRTILCPESAYGASARYYYSGENQPSSRSDSITRISRPSLENVSPLTNRITFHGEASLSRDSGRCRSNFVHVGRWANCDTSRVRWFYY